MRGWSVKWASALSILFLILITCCNAANAQIADQTNGWYMYFGNHRLSERWGVHSEYQWRRHGFVEHWMQSLVRIGVNHHLPGGVIISSGYGWIRSFPYGEQPIPAEFDEHRLWQQLVFGQQIGRFHFQHRYRLEQRWMEQKTLVEGGDDFERMGMIFRQRMRYRFFVSIPLIGPELSDNSLFLALYDEPFIQFGSNIGLNVLDQNRLYAALGWRIDKNRNVQIGYLNHYWIKPDGVRAERNHTLQVGITWDLDLRP